jgi:KUP system potassium uptake protein
MLPVTASEVKVPTEVILLCAAVVTVPAVVAAPVNAPTNVVEVTLVSPATVVTVAPRVSAVLPSVTAALAKRACVKVPVEMLVALIDVTLAPDPCSVPTKLPLVVLPVTANAPNVPTLVILGCAAVVLFFKESSAMEAAYGLTIIIGMMMSSTLLVFYMRMKRFANWIIGFFIVTYLTVESSFLVANMKKIPEGGYISLFIALFIALIMWIWYDARKIRNSYVEFVDLNEYLDLLCELKADLTVPKYATHLVFLTSANYDEQVESKIIYSILQKQPKRADIYWFLHVDVVDEPYRMEYKVNEIVNDAVIRIDFYLGFRVAPRINLMFRKVVQDLVKQHEVDIVSRYESLNKNQVIGDFRFIVLEKFLSNENELPFYEKIVLDIYFMLKSISLSEEKAFGLDTSSVHVEKVPLIIAPPRELHLKRIK